MYTKNEIKNYISYLENIHINNIIITSVSKNIYKYSDINISYIKIDNNTDTGCLLQLFIDGYSISNYLLNLRKDKIIKIKENIFSKKVTI